MLGDAMGVRIARGCEHGELPDHGRPRCCHRSGSTQFEDTRCWQRNHYIPADSGVRISLHRSCAFAGVLVANLQNDNAKTVIRSGDTFGIEQGVICVCGRSLADARGSVTGTKLRHRDNFLRAAGRSLPCPKGLRMPRVKASASRRIA